MPGWHAKTKALHEAGKVQVAGIIEEQHPDRCRLFMQWQQMSWPILVDSLDLLGLSAVPLTYLIDEHGIIRYGPRAKAEDLEAFLGTSYPPPAESLVPASAPDLNAHIDAFGPREAKASAADWMAHGDALFLRGRADDLTRCVDAFQKAIELDGPPEARFRLGVALRRRYESDLRHAGDFQASLTAWSDALEREPNMYIWRRRIQQYGPRLDKPYPFYDWVTRARQEIRARGEKPAPLSVEPSGAEFAQRASAFEVSETEARDPDPQARIHRDRTPLIKLEIAVAPGTDPKQQAARVHLVLTPNAGKKGHWNNEAEPLVVWLNPPKGVTVDRRRLTTPNPDAEISSETRRIEFEAHYDRDVLPRGKPVTIAGYALYYVCEDENGVCQFLRKDFEVPLAVD